MNENFREFLERLRQEKELLDIRQAVDIRHIATLVDQSEHALLFHNVIGYDMPVVSGILRTQRRATMSMGCSKYPEIEARLRQGIDHPIAPRHVETAPHKQVIKLGDEVDLFKLPIPMSSIYDGGPMITAGVVIARDPEYGINSGIYRFLVKEKNLTGDTVHIQTKGGEILNVYINEEVYLEGSAHVIYAADLWKEATE